jgi:hypothetical protein
MGDGVNPIQDPPTPTLRGRWLLAARTGWVAVATLILGLVTTGFAVGLDRPEQIHPQSAQAAVAQAGVPGQVTIVVALIIPMVAFTGTGMLIFWRRSNDWAAMLFALTLVTGAGFSMRALWALEQAMPALRLPARLVGTPWTGGAGLVAVLGLVCMPRPTATGTCPDRCSGSRPSGSRSP